MKKLVLLISIVLSAGLVGLASGQTPPAGAILHLVASEVTTSGSDVTDWADQAGGDNDTHWDPSNSTGYGQLDTATFPNGTFDTVIFNGDASYIIDNEDDLNLDELLVVAITSPYGANTGNGSILANHAEDPECGYNMARSGDPSGSNTYFWNGWNDMPVEEPNVTADRYWSNAPPADVPTITSFVYSESTRNKAIFHNGTFTTIQHQDGWSNISYQDAVASLGSLGAGGHLDNEITELLVYGSADRQLQADVEEYLSNKYGIDVAAYCPPIDDPNVTPILWLKADDGVITDENGIIEWMDQGGCHNAYLYAGSPGYPQLTTYRFPSGFMPVVQFNGDARFEIYNDDDLDINEFTIYMVEGDHKSPNSGWLISNFEQGSGWNGWGISMEGEGHWYFFSNAGGDNMEFYNRQWSGQPPPAAYTERWFTTTFMFKAEGKSIWCMNDLIAEDLLYDCSNELLLPIAYSDPVPYFYCNYSPYSSFTLGGNGGAYYKGYVAELIIYGAAHDDTRRAEICQMLYDKYWEFVPWCGDWGHLKGDLSGPEGDPDCYVDVYDVAALAVGWMKCTDPTDPANCVDLLFP